MVNFLKHLFIPHHSNNFRAKLLHHRIISLVILFLLFLSPALTFISKSYPSVLGISTNVNTNELIILTNQERSKSGLPPLTLNDSLARAAERKANDMFEKNYWAHYSPDGLSPWFFIKTEGYNYLYAGENLGRGFINTQDLINAWMASPTHRENILSPNFQEVGFAVVTGNLEGEETVLIVEEFGGKEAPIVVAKKEPVATETAVNTLSVTPAPTVLPSATPIPQTASLTGTLSKESFNPRLPVISLSAASSTFAVSIVMIFMGVFVLDLIFLERKRLARLRGHSLDHIFFLLLIFSLILILNKGSII